MIHNLVTGGQTGLLFEFLNYSDRSLSRKLSKSANLWLKSQYYSEDILCIYSMTPILFFFHLFFTSLSALFVSNPLLSGRLYYTAESIFEGIKAIKGFIYPYLERNPRKVPGMMQSETLSTGSPQNVPAAISWQGFPLYPFIKKSSSCQRAARYWCGSWGGSRVP